VLALIIGGGYWLFVNNKNAVPSQNIQTETTPEETTAEPIGAPSIVGTWQSTEDANFVRVFNEDFTSEDRYDGEVVSNDLWVTFNVLNAPEVAFPLEQGETYLQITTTEEPAETLTFRVAELTHAELELVYMDRGGVLVFTRVE